MKRNSFNKAVALGLGTGFFNPFSSIAESNASGREKKKIRPKKLEKGSTIGLITPASPISEEKFRKAIQNIENLGFKYKTGNHIFDKYGYLAGSDNDRINDLHMMFSDSEIDAIWCIRGGYGTTRIIDALDYNLIKNNPKIFIGFSDITAIHLAIMKKTGLITFHGPVAASEFTDYTTKCFVDLFLNDEKAIENYVPDINNESEIYKPQSIVSGKMEGRLVGGNLTLLASLAGTPYQLNPENNIVFIEDIDERPYRIDRMLTQLLKTTNLSKASGILLGVFEGCEAKEEDKYSLKILETLKDRLGDLGIPVFYGFSFGHIDNNCTIPVGCKAMFDTETQKLRIEEKIFI
jgi:muramoyltetrapeptide carboxypeptidase